ncbi:MAG: methionine ABC transporter substrate-binding protein [Caldibacillus debilis]|uniref:Lipoprotein n=1 Tax=Caldibacillus debilis TaxID=301148 RepID=A0A3E0K191_9BACI|nr:MetQ/NlpA family ABC transporter substrate-binding protein [Caldibacillus debilis]OUM90521.1 MAG: methionine ABC transporter substrate-binding protein [Caldibacillus debilis]REJ16241.1 MAG: methionine ABC transporter substrate-binding protein [Caldibacillus debilis]REJ26344.1 MAG: methionine ABC transporter substrate-binding protein [Caldibacillus debilis]REJ27341.1 MAG: methionine ABC transporter substrate-binding protein [Caldibacillus debilis]
MYKKIGLSLIAVLLFALLSACKGETASDEKKVVKIGVTGTDGQVWDIIKEKAAKEGITIELVEFSDYTLPNQALADKEIDLNAFQHIAFLNQFKEEHHLDIVPIGTTVIAPMGIYSEKYKDVSEIPDKAKIAIPDDPSNQARALKLLQSAGLIKLKEDFGLFGDLSGIKENPKKLEIIPMVAQQTPRVLPDVAASVINNGIAGQAGFVPNKDAIFLEDPNDPAAQPYINVFAARAEDKDNQTFKKIVEIYHDPEVVEAIKKDTNGGSVVVDIPIEELEDIIK